MFRATVLSFVLAFAAGPSASLFCKAWCDPPAAPSSGCLHQGTGGSASLTSYDSCQDAVPGVAVLLKDDLRRALSLDSGLALVTARYPLDASSATNPRGVWHPGQAPSDTRRPLTTPLRI